MRLYGKKSLNLYGSTFKGSEVKIFRCPATVKGLRLRMGSFPATVPTKRNGKARKAIPLKPGNLELNPL